jgi:biotin carboxylase
LPTPTIVFMGTRRVPLEVHAALLAANDAGYRVALVAPSAPTFCAQLLSDVEIVDIFDRPAALKAARALATRTRACGVVSWTDIGVELAARLAALCGWPGVPVVAAHRARNKLSMRAALRDHPGLIPRFRQVRDLDGLVEAKQEIGTPAVLKPAGGSGSRSILQVDHDSDPAALFAEATRLTTPEVAPLFADYPGEFVYEERLGGSEHSVEGLVHDGMVHIAGITDKWVTEPFYVEYEQVHPTVLPAATQKRVHALTRTVIEAIGLNWCAFHLELRVLPDGSAKFLEVAARPGGGYITSHLVPMSTGIAFHGNLIRIATGSAPDISPTKDLYAGSRGVLSLTEGRFGGFAGLPRVLDLWGLEHFVFEREVGGRVVLPPGDTLSAVLGYVIARSVSYDDVRATLRRAVELSRPQVTT